MESQEFYNEIIELLSRGHEGGYWDYKRDYPECQEDKLKDIICMANNLENRDAYLIYGANDDGTVYGIQNTKHKSRITSMDVVKFLRDKPFAGGYYPETEVRTIVIGPDELDVLVIFNRKHTPYYLQEKFGNNAKQSKNLMAGTIYTRTFDGNTPPYKTASIEQTEYLWRKRFGFDLTPYQRLLNLLERPERWSDADWDNCLHCYNSESPEYQIIVGESKIGYEDLSYYYDDETMYYAPLKLNYLSTTLYETELWYMDGGRCLITLPEKKHMAEKRIFYYYILKNSVNGMLLPFFSNRKFQCHDRSGMEIPILLFRNEKEQKEYETWVNDNQDRIKYIEEKLSDNAIYAHIISKATCDGRDRTQGIRDIAIAFGLYKEWNNGLCNGKCFMV